MRVEPGSVPKLGVGTELFALTGLEPASPHPNYDVSPDGRAFAFVQGHELSRVAVIQNLAGLYERMKGKR